MKESPIPAKFKLPAHWYRETISELVRTELPRLLGPLTSKTAWRYVYATVLWAEQKDGTRYFHLNDRLANQDGKELANRGAEYLRRHLVPGGTSDPFAIVNHIGRKYDEGRLTQGFEPMKRRDPNVTGAAFETALQVVISQLTDHTPMRTPKLRSLRGFELAPEGYHSEPDLAMFTTDDFRLLISTKWTLRKERIGTYLHEAYFYKQRRSDLQVAFVVNEFNTNILNWLAHDPLVDRVYHVNLPMFLDLHAPFRDVPEGGMIPKARLMKPGQEQNAFRRWLSLSDRVFDLSQLFADIETLSPLSEAAPADPESDPGEADNPDGSV